MQSVTQAFTDTLKRPEFKATRSVSYKRRFWNGAAFEWEAGWTALPETKVESVSLINTQLDTQLQNEFKVSNVTIALQNLANEWKPSNQIGVFGPDSGSPTFGYEPRLMKWRIQAGLIKDDGSTELVTLFTGVAVEYNFNIGRGIVEISVAGEQTLLAYSNAEEVSTTVVKESVGTGNGSNKDFYTSNNGVGLIRAVYVDGVLKRPGPDYSIGQINDPVNPGKISFAAAPAGSTAITCTYLYWKQNQPFETLVTDLLNQSGIPGGNQFVEPALFPNSIVSTHEWQISTDWTAGTLSNAAVIGNVIELQAAGESVAGSGVNPGYLNIPSAIYGSDGLATRIIPPASGTITQVNLGVSIGWGSGPSTVNVRVALYSESGGVPGSLISSVMVSNTVDYTRHWSIGAVSTSWTVTGGTAYWIVYEEDPSMGNNCIFKMYMNVASSSWSGGSNSYARYVPFGTCPGQPGSTTGWEAVEDSFSSGPIGACAGSYSFSADPGTWESQVIDWGGTPSSYALYTYAQVLNGGTIQYYTNASSDGSTWDGWVAVPPSGLVGSALKRYFKTQVIFNGTNATPLVSLIQVGVTTTSTGILLANFTGMTCYDAIAQLAQFANYEFGFDANENFFFRPKAAGSVPVLSISQSDFLVDAPSILTGDDLVSSSVRTTYGAYTSEYDDPNDGPLAPKNRVGYVLNEISGGNLLISADADVATGAAQAFFNRYKIARRKFKVQTKFLPQLELSDVIAVTYNDTMPGQWFWGDSQTYWGMPSIYYYGPDAFALYNQGGKIVGQRIDTELWMCEFDLEEAI